MINPSAPTPNPQPPTPHVPQLPDALLEFAGAVSDLADPAAVDALRRRWPAELVRLAIDLVIARRKAADKFPPDLAAKLFADPAAVEQATSLDIARHKARRFAAAGFHRVIDLCCGIGGDAIALAEVLRGGVMLVDLDPTRLASARRNVELATGVRLAAAVADVTTLRLDHVPFHLDPARRAGSRRLLRLEDMRPGPGFLMSLLNRCPDGAVKLSPGIDFAALSPGEVELISRRGRVVQAVLWTGRLARSASLRTATTFPTGASFSGQADLAPPIAPPSRFLLEVDPAIERGGLLGVLARELHLAAVHPSLGLLTAEHDPVSPWLTPFELLERIPWRLKKVKRWLADHDAGLVEVKTRGKAVDPDIAAAALRGEGQSEFTVFVLREGHTIAAWVCRRVR